MKFDLNCDLGEGEAPARTRSLMRWITSANVACGGHAGNARTMAACVRWAAEHGVRIGAHPGAGTREDFGRGSLRTLHPDELEALLHQQIGALQRIASDHDAELRHVKLHGALYHATEQKPQLRRRYLDTMRRCWPELTVVAQAGGSVARQARQLGLMTREEGFLDRAYIDGRHLVSRSQPGAVWTDAAMIMDRLRLWLETGTVISRSGRKHRLPVETWCVHGDTPGAPRLLRAIHRFLGQQD